MAQNVRKLEQHHTLFHRYAWNANKELAALRNNPQLVVPLDHETHRELHAEVSHIPPLSLHVARHALRGFSDYGYTSNHLQAVGRLQRSIEAAARHPKADYIEKSIAELVCHGLDIQKPFLDDTDNTYYIGGRYGKATA